MKVTLLVLMTAFLTFSCGKTDDKETDSEDTSEKDSSSESEDDEQSQKKATLKPTFKTTKAGSSLLLNSGPVSHNTSASITSFQYYVTRIDLCENVDVNGSGYSGMKNCSTVFGESDSSNDYSGFKIEQAKIDTSDNWIDLLKEREETAVAINAGTYNFMIVETRKPVKLNATMEITQNNSTVTLKTCDGGTVTSAGEDGDLLETTTVSDMTSCELTTATLGARGGGHYFRFQTPIILEEGETYALDFASNPEALIAGGIESIGGWGTEATYKDGNYVMLIPPISLHPVIRSTQSKTILEQYELSGMTGINGKIIVDLYYAGATSDVGSGTIIAAGSRFVSDANASTLVKMYNPYAVTADDDGKLQLKDHDSVAYITGLTRSTSENANTNMGTASVNKSTVTNTSSNGSTETVEATVTFIGAKEL